MPVKSLRNYILYINGQLPSIDIKNYTDNIRNIREGCKKSRLRFTSKCKKTNTKIGICGQGPSEYPEISAFLVEKGIDTISITPDSLVKTINIIHDVENN